MLATRCLFLSLSAMVLAASCQGSNSRRDHCPTVTTFPTCARLNDFATFGIDPDSGQCEVLCDCEEWPPCDGGAG